MTALLAHLPAVAAIFVLAVRLFARRPSTPFRRHDRRQK